MNKIKMSAPDWCFLGKSGLEPEKYYCELRKMGFTAVEMTEKKNRTLACNAGLEILNMAGPGMTKGLNRIENHKEILPQIRSAIQEAKADKIPAVIIFSGNREGQADVDGLKNCRTGIEQVIGDAEKAGVILLFEMLNSFEHADYQADSSKYGFELVKTIKSKNFKLLYDIYHMERMGEDAAKDISANLDVIAHLHTAESPDRTIPLVAGKINYAEIVSKVRLAGYDGFWGMEFIPKGNVMEELKRTAKMFGDVISNQ
jgi:hydroxypyruvate isomerase